MSISARSLLAASVAAAILISPSPAHVLRVTESEFFSSRSDISSSFLVGNQTIVVPDFDTAGGTRVLTGIEVTVRLAVPSDIRGEVEADASPGQEVQAELLVSGAVSSTLPGRPTETLAVEGDGSVTSNNGPFSPRTVGADFTVGPGGVVVFDEQTLSASSVFDGGDDWPVRMSWSLASGFDIQDGPPGIWSYTHDETRLGVIVFGRYLFETVCRADTTTDGTSNGIPDGAVTLSDFSYYLGLWAGSDSAADLTTDGTSNGIPDGTVTLSDFSFYLSLWSAGCP